MSPALRWTVFASIFFALMVALYVLWTGVFDTRLTKAIASFVLVTGAVLAAYRLAITGTATSDDGPRHGTLAQDDAVIEPEAPGEREAPNP